MTQSIVHVVDDDEAMRESVSFLLGAEGIDAKTYGSAAELLARYESLESGCIVTDVRMPGMSGLELVVELKRRQTRHPVIVLTGHADVAMAVQAMKEGVSDFLEKPFLDEDLIRAVKSALAHAGGDRTRVGARSEYADRAAQLTVREREVFEAVAAGLSNKAVAQKLGISPRTVEIYRANVMAKMQAGSLSDLVRMALDLGVT